MMSANLLYDAAFDARFKRGWSVIPIRADASTKPPALKSWKRYQKQLPTEENLRQWFIEGRGIIGKVVGVGAICGGVSGGLQVRDFDKMESYERFVREHPALARTLPTVETARGTHVYNQAADNRIVVLPDGELRSAGYVLIPPSIHPSGKVYKWLVSLPTGPLLSVNPNLLMGDAGETGELLRPSGMGEHFSGSPLPLSSPPPLSPDVVIPVSPVFPVSPVSPVKQGEIDEVVGAFVPVAEGQRNYRLFRLARKLKFLYPGVKPSDLRPIVRRWHELALPAIKTKAWDESWADFVRGWTVAKKPLGESKLTALLVKADASPMPSIVGQYETPEVRRLIALCAAIQAEAVGEPFPIAQSAFAGAMGVTQMTVSRYVGMLVADGVLAQTYRGHTGRAGEYIYTADVKGGA